MVGKKLLTIRLKEKLEQQGKNLSITDTEDIVEAYGAVILDALANGEEITCPNVGKFFVKVLKSRVIKNSGIAWIKDKSFTVPKTYKIGFRSSVSADTQVKDSLTSLLNTNVSNTELVSK